MFWPFANTWRFRSIFSRGGLKRRFRGLRRRSWLFGSGITIEATDRDDGRFSCQLEQLEPKKVLDADFNLTSGTLTITLDDDNQAITFVPTSSTGNYTFTLTGAATDNFVGTDGGGVSGNGGSVLTVENTALIDDIVVTTNGSITSGGFTFLSAAPGHGTLENLTVDVDGAVSVGTDVLFLGSASLDVVDGSCVTITGGSFNIAAAGGHLNIAPALDSTTNPELIAETINVTAINTFNQGIRFVGDAKIAGAVTNGGAIQVTGNLATTVAGPISATTLNVTGDTSLGAAVTTSGSQAYAGNFAVTAAVAVTSTAAGVSFGGGIDGNGNPLTVSIFGSTAINGANITNLSSLAVTGQGGGGSVALVGPIVTTTTQTYSVPTVALTGDTTLNATTASFTTDTTVAGGGHNLTVNGNFVTVGITGLQNLNVTGTTTAANAISTSGNQTYGGTVSLTGDTTLTGATLSYTGFSGGGARDLTLTFTDRVELDGSKFVGISDFVTSGAGGVNLSGTFSTVRTQTFGGGGVSLVGDATLKTTTGGSGGRIVFTAPTIDGAHNLTLTRDSGIADYFDIQSTIGATTQLASLSVSGANDVYLHQNVSTAGTQTYGPSRSLFLQKSGALNLTASEVVISSPVQGYTAAPDVTIAGNLDLSGAFTSGIGSGELVNSLTVTGDANFTGNVAVVTDLTVGGNAVIGGAVSAGNLSVGADANISGAVALSSDFEVGGNLILSENLTATRYLNVAGAATIGNPSFSISFLPLSVNSNEQWWRGTINLAGNTALNYANQAQGYRITACQTVDGGGFSLSSSGLFVSYAALGNLSDFAGSGEIGGNITATGSITLGAVEFFGPNPRVLTAPSVSIGSAVDNFGLSTNLVVDGNLTVGTLTRVNLINVTGTTTFTGATTIDGDGPMFFNQTVTLGGDTVFNATSVTFADPIQAICSSTGANLQIEGNLTLSGLASSLGVLTVNGTSVLGGNVTSSGNQTYTGAVTLSGGNRTLSADTVNFTSTVDGGSAGLTITGDAEINAGMTNLTTVSVSGSTALTGNVTSTGNQTYSGNVAFSSVSTLNASGATVTLGGEVTGAPGGSVTVTGDLDLNGNANLPGGLSVSGSADLGGNVSTGTYSQSYAGPVTLSGADRVLTASLVNFQNTVVGGGNSLNVAGPATFGATVSGLDDLSVSGNASVAANVTGTGSQTFTGRVNLTGDATFTGTSGSFSGGLEGGANALGLNYSTLVTIDGATTFSNIASLTSTGPAELNGTINTTGLQSYGSAVTLLGATDLTASNVTFGSTVAGGASPLNVTGDLFIDGAVTNLAGLDVTGNTDLGANITTVSGGQTYNGTVVLTGGGTRTLTGSGQTVSFLGDLDGGSQALHVNANLDLQADLSNLSSFEAQNTATLGGNVTTSGGQRFFGGVNLATDATLTSTSNDTVQFDAAVTGGGNNLTIAGQTLLKAAVSGIYDLSVSNNATIENTVSTTNNQTYSGPVVLGGTAGQFTGNVVSFGGTVDGGSRNINIAGDAAVAGAVSNASTFAVSGATDLGANVSTTNAQTYSGAVDLTGDATLVSTSGGVAFGSTVDGGFNLALSTPSGTANLAGGIGQTAPLASLDVAASAIDVGANIATTGDQDFGAGVTLTGDATLNSSAGNVSFSGQVNGGQNLVVTTAGGVANFTQGAGLSSCLASLTTDAAILSGDVKTSGTQSYGNLTLTNGDRTFTGTVVTFGGDVDAGNAAITVSGSTAIDESITNATAITVTGATDLGGNVTTSGNQSYQSTVNLTGASVLTADKATLGAITGNNASLEINAAAVLSGGVNLASLSVSGTTSLSGDIETNGNQSYTGQVTSTGGDRNLNGSTVSLLGGYVSSNQNLAVAGNLVVGGEITAVNTLSVSGMTDLGGNVTTLASQTYSGNVTLSGGDRTLTGTLVTFGVAAEGEIGKSVV